MRIAASELVFQLSENFGVEMLGGFTSAGTALLGQADSMRAAGDGNWWKPREAVLLGMGRLAEELTDAMQQNQIQLDLAGLFSHVVLDSLNAAACPFLQGRAIWFASRFTGVLPTELALQYVGAAAAALTQSDSIPVKICAVKAIHAFSSTMEASVLQPFQRQMLEGLLNLTTNASEEIGVLLLETIMPVLKIDAQTTAAYEQRVTEQTLEIWSRFHAGKPSPLICGVVYGVNR